MASIDTKLRRIALMLECSGVARQGVKYRFLFLFRSAPPSHRLRHRVSLLSAQLNRCVGMFLPISFAGAAIGEHTLLSRQHTTEEQKKNDTKSVLIAATCNEYSFSVESIALLCCTTTVLLYDRCPTVGMYYCYYYCVRICKTSKCSRRNLREIPTEHMGQRFHRHPHSSLRLSSPGQQVVDPGHSPQQQANKAQPFITKNISRGLCQQPCWPGWGRPPQKQWEWAFPCLQMVSGPSRPKMFVRPDAYCGPAISEYAMRPGPVI